jgi:hypothetical protein
MVTRGERSFAASSPRQSGATPQLVVHNRHWTASCQLTCRPAIIIATDAVAASLAGM